MNVLPHEAPLNPVLARLGRVFAARNETRSPPRDPEFLPDFTSFSPDQVNEMRYGLGRDRSHAKGRDQ